MGNYFVMSTRFDKSSAADFGLVPIDESRALRPSDNSKWVRTHLYDFGGGSENGYYRVPLPSFDTLWELALHSSDKADKYGAAAVILDRYSDELLCRCELYMNDSALSKAFVDAANVFELQDAKNRSPVLGKTYSQISKDYERWAAVAKAASKMMRR